MAKSKIAGLTVEIGGNTTKLGKALSGVDSKARATSSELREVNNALKKAPESVELWKQKQQLLTQAIETSREKLAKLEEVQKDIQRQYDNGDIGEDAYRAYQREVEKTKGELEGFEKQLEKTNEDMKEAGRQADETGDDFAEAGEKAEASSGGFTVLKGAMADLVAEGIKKATAAMKEYMDSALEYEDSIAKLDTIAQGVEIEQLSDDILELSNRTGIAATDLADAAYNAISAGQDTADAVRFVEKATGLARAGFAETGDTIDILTTILNAYGLETDKVAQVSDVLIQTQNLGKTTVAELSSAMGKVIPTANAAGVELEQLAAGYAVMTANGVATAETTTYLNSMLNELSKSGTKSSDTLKEKTGKSFQELVADGNTLADILAIISEAAEEQGLAFGDLWGSAEAGKAGLILLGESAENYNSTLVQMKTAAGATDKALAKLETDSYKIQKAENQVKNELTKLGAEALKQLMPIAEKWVPKIIDQLPEILDTGKKMIPVVGALGAAVGAMKIADQVDKAVPKIKGLEKVFTAASSSAAFLPVTIAAVAGALIVGGMSYVTATEEARQAHLEEVFEKATEKTDELTGKIYGNIDAIKAQKDAAAEKIEADEQEINKIQALREELDKLTDKNGVVKEGYEERVRYITEELGQATGIEIEYIDGQIQKYDELKQSLDDVIDKKRAESMASAYESIYQEAIRQNEEAADSLQALKEDISANQYEIDKLYRDAKREAEERNVSYGDFGEFSYANIMKMQKENLDTWSTLLNEAQLEKLYAYEQNIRSAQNAWDALHDSATQNELDIEAYEEAFKAMAEGNYKEAQDYYNRIGNLDLVALRKAKGNIDEQKKAFIDGVNAAVKKYNNELELGLSGSKEKFTKTIATLTEQGRQGGLTIGDLLSTGIVDQLNTIDGFDDSGLQEFARIAGWNFGDNFGTEAAEASAQAFLAAESISERVSGTMARLSSLPFFAGGGFLASGQGIVAEAGPELLEVMNGGVRITPLTRDARNTPVQTTGGGAGSSTKIYNNYISATIKGSYDVYKLAEDMSTAERIMDNAKGV